MGKLTAFAVKAATLPGRYQDGDGLMLLVKPSGSRSWQVRIQVDGKRRDFGLGSASVVSLADARTKAIETRKLCKEGGDPVARKQKAKRDRVAIPTFRSAADSAHAEYKGSWRNTKHSDDWLSSLKAYAFPSIGNLRIDLVDAPMIRDLLLPIWLEKPETARRVRQRIKAIIGWAASKGFRMPLDLSVMDGGLPKQPKHKGHFKAMDYEKLPAFVALVRTEPETIGRLALLFTILTAARSGETRGATWNEFNIKAATWTIPADRMKGGREHIVPLSPPVISILKRMAALRTETALEPAVPRESGKPREPVFPGKSGKPISDMTMSKILRDMDLTDTVHGFRSAFKDWASEASSYPDAVSEAALAHLDQDKTRAAYRRTVFLKMRTEQMAAWAVFVDGRSSDVADLDEARRRKELAG